MRRLSIGVLVVLAACSSSRADLPNLAERQRRLALLAPILLGQENTAGVDPKVLEKVSCVLDDDWKSPGYQLGIRESGQSVESNVTFALMACDEGRFDQLAPAFAELLGTVSEAEVQALVDKGAKAIK